MNENKFDFEKLKNVLLSLGVPVYHDEALKVKPPYIRWSQSAVIRAYADNKTAHKGWRVAVDYFTLKEYDELPEELEKKLEGADFTITDTVRDYEEETGYVHYAYTIEVLDCG